MASKRRQRRHQCERKQKHTKEEAFGVALRMRYSHGDAIDAYPCANCGGWHVGHRPYRVQQRISARRKAAQ